MNVSSSFVQQNTVRTCHCISYFPLVTSY